MYGVARLSGCNTLPDRPGGPAYGPVNCNVTIGFDIFYVDYWNTAQQYAYPNPVDLPCIRVGDAFQRYLESSKMRFIAGEMKPQPPGQLVAVDAWLIDVPFAYYDLHSET